MAVKIELKNAASLYIKFYSKDVIDAGLALLVLKNGTGSTKIHIVLMSQMWDWFSQCEKIVLGRMATEKSGTD